MKQSFRAFTFVSDDEDSDDASSSGDSMEESGSHDETPTPTPTPPTPAPASAGMIDFEDPEYIVKSILKGLTSRPSASSASSSSKRQRTATPPPPVAASTTAETEHERQLRLRAERFKAGGVAAPPTTPAAAAPPPLSVLDSVKKVLQSSPEPPLASSSSKKSKAASALVLSKKTAAAVLKLTKPIELASEAVANLASPALSLQSLQQKLAQLFAANNIAFSVSKDNKSVLLFPVPLQLDDKLFHWLWMKHSYPAAANAGESSLNLPTSPGCVVFSFGPTKEQLKNGKLPVYDVRWLGASKLDRYEYLFEEVLAAAEGGGDAKVNGALANRANALLLFRPSADDDKDDEEEEDDHDELTAQSLLRVRRDVLRRRNARVDRDALVARAAAACPQPDFLPGFFKRERCTPLFGAEVLLKSGHSKWAQLDLAPFREADWVHAAVPDKFVNEDNAFTKRVAAFLFKAKVKFKYAATATISAAATATISAAASTTTTPNSRVLEINSPLKLEDGDVHWILCVNSMLLLEEDAARVRDLVQQRGKGCVMFAFGCSPRIELPQGSIAVDWRLLAVDGGGGNA